MNRNERINDELLVLSSQEGSAEAFEQLVGRWQERLWRFAWRLTDDEQAAWDVSQEIWSVVSREIRNLEDATAFPAWVYRIAGNKSRDWIRRRQRQRRVEDVYGERRKQCEQERETVEQRCADLKEALAHMSGRDRTILSLRYEEGFATGEISEILDIPPGTVKSRLYYARERLRHFLEKEDNG
jgi:RNA polymerase sigma-70 factor (ECF subfamily)